MTIPTNPQQASEIVVYWALRLQKALKAEDDQHDDELEYSKEGLRQAIIDLEDFVGELKLLMPHGEQMTKEELKKENTELKTKLQGQELEAQLKKYELPKGMPVAMREHFEDPPQVYCPKCNFTESGATTFKGRLYNPCDPGCCCTLMCPECKTVYALAEDKSPAADYYRTLDDLENDDGEK